MLDNIREGVKKPWVKIVIFAIVISFVFAGYFSTAFFLGDPNAVVIVNGESISKSEFQRAYSSEKARQADFYSATVKTEEDEKNYQESVIQSLIDSKVRELAVRDLGIQLSSSALREIIQSDPNYQIDGKYSSALVDQTLVRLQWSREKFKAAYESQETAQQMFNGVFGSEFALEKEAINDYKISSQKRSGRAIQVNVARFKEGISISDEEILKYYQENQEAFRIEEKVSVNYLELSATDLTASQTVADEQISDYYQNNIERFKTEEQRQVAHILVLSNDDDDAALTRINAIRARLDAEEDFADLARTESDDIPTRASGGDLGILIPGGMDENFELAANSLTKVGDVSNPVKSDFGYHLIKLTNLIEGSAQPLEEVRDSLVTELKKSHAELGFITLSEKLTSAAFEVSDTLANAAEITGLEIKHSSLFGLNSGEGLFSNQDLRNAAFSSEVKDGLLNSTPIDIGDNHLIVLRINEYKASEIQPLENVKDRIVNNLKQVKAKIQSSELAQSLLEKIKSKQPLDELLVKHKLNWIDLDRLDRNNASLAYAVSQEFFKMPTPSEGSVNLKMVEDKQGHTILLLNTVEQGLWTDADESTKSQRKQYVNSYYFGAEYAAFIQNLRINADISRNQFNLSQ